MWDLLNMNAEINSWYRESNLPKPIRYILLQKSRRDFNKILDKYITLGRYDCRDIFDLYSYIFYKYEQPKRQEKFPDMFHIKVIKGTKGNILDLVMYYRTLHPSTITFGAIKKPVSHKTWFVTTNNRENRIILEGTVEEANGNIIRYNDERSDLSLHETDNNQMKLNMLYDIYSIISNDIRTVFEDMNT